MGGLVYYVVRQRAGWSVEHDGLARSGHGSKEEAIAAAKQCAANAKAQGFDCCVRVQEDAGAWREEISFAPV